MRPPLRLALALLAAGAAVSGRGAQPTPDPDDGGLLLPAGFRALVVADNLVAGRKIGKDNDNLRFLAIAPNGDLYAKTFRGGIFALRDADGDGRFEQKHEFGEGGGTGIALHHGWLYHSTNSEVYRYKYTPGELVPTGAAQLMIGGLPDRRQHEAKSFAFDGEGRLMVEIGSPANAYSDGDRGPGAKGKDATEFLKTHGGFWRFDPDKPNQTQADGFHFSTGHRHSLALAWQPAAQAFYMVQMGRDQMNVIAPEFYDELDNAERVAEEMHRLTEGVNLGWPYTYWDPIKKARMVGPEFGGDNRKRDDNPLYDKPVIAFPAHWAALQMTSYGGTQFPAKYRGGFFIAFHGSWNRAPRPQAGFNVTYVPCDEKGAPLGTYETFADGFRVQPTFASTREAQFRPGGLVVGPDGSLYVGDTDKGRIWRIIYTGETREGSAIAPPGVAAQTAPPIGADTPGGKIYMQVCAACHMPSGSGVPSMQPALIGSAIVAGDTTRLINVVLRGPAAVLPADRAKFSNVMPPFAVFTDADIASVINYLRHNFAPGAADVSPAQVAAERARMPAN